MSIWTSLEPASATVDAGGSTTVTLRVRNTGGLVEEYRVAPLGGPARWLRVEPAVLTLHPGTTGTVELLFTPPRTPEVAAGPHPYALQITPAEQRSATTVVEGVLRVAPFTDLRAELVPPASGGRFRGRFRLAVDNLGNAPVTAVLAGRDAADRLDLAPRPSSVRIDPGRAVFATVVVKPRRIRWSGGSRTLPVTLAVRPADTEPLTVEGHYLNRAVLTGWAAAVPGTLALALLGFLSLWVAAAPSVASRAKPAAPVAAGAITRAALPIKAGDRTPNLFVLFAQERLKRLDATNGCRLTGPVTAGVMDADTVERITCFQKATDDHGRTPAGTLLATDGAGNLGRSTLSALWMLDVIGDGSEVGPGRTGWEVFATRAALRWADRSELSAADTAAAEDDVRRLTASWNTGTALPSASYDDARLAAAIRKYQTDQPVAAGGAGTALNALISGRVKDETAPGTVQPTTWPEP